MLYAAGKIAEIRNCRIAVLEFKTFFVFIGVIFLQNVMNSTVQWLHLLDDVKKTIKRNDSLMSFSLFSKCVSKSMNNLPAIKL